MTKQKMNYELLTEIKCNKCSQTKPKTEYYKNKWSYCKKCWGELNVKQVKKYKEKSISVKITKTTEKIVKKPSVNIDFELDLSLLHNLEDENKDKTDKKDEIDVKEYLKSLENVENEPEKVKSIQDKYYIIDSEGYERSLNRASDRTMEEQIKDFCLVGRFVVFRNDDKIASGVGNGVDIEIKYMRCERLFTESLLKYKLLVEYTNNELEEMTIREFTELYGYQVIIFVGRDIKPEHELSWKYCIKRVEKIKIK